MARSCPWCCEPLDRSVAGAVRCPRCDRPLVDPTDGRELRAVDVRYELVRAVQRERLQRFLVVGAVIVAMVSLVLPLAHAASVLVAPILVAVHLVATRFAVIGEARRLLGRRRQIFTRWVVRLLYVWIGVPGYGLAAVPLVGPLFGVATFGGLTLAAHAYTQWSLEREARRQPQAGWELVVLVSLAVVTTLAVATLVAVGLVVGWSVAWLLDLARTATGG